jgi:hypothetical protein
MGHHKCKTCIDRGSYQGCEIRPHSALARGLYFDGASASYIDLDLHDTS